jgi:hypothetical protein
MYAFGGSLDAFSGRQNLLSEWREQIARGGPMEQRSAKCRFQSGQPAAYGRMLDGEFARGYRNAAGTRHGKKDTKAVPVHVCIFAHRIVRQYLWRRRLPARML